MHRAIERRRNIGQFGEGADVRTHRIADHHRVLGDPAGRLLQHWEGACDGANMAGEPPVGPAHYCVLLMQQGRPALGDPSQQARHGRIAAEAHHDIGLDPGEGGASLQHATHDGDAGLGHAHGIAAPEGPSRKPDAFLGGEALGEGGGALIGGEHDTPASRNQGFGQRLSRK